MWHRNNLDVHDPNDERKHRPKRRKREGRGLGPFSSGHLTIMLVTLVLVVAFPFAAFAVTGNNVFVTDASTGNRATVAGGKLKVDAGLVAVAPVAPEIYPTSAIVHSNDGFGSPVVTANSDCPSACTKLIAPPSGKALVIASIHVDTYQNAAPGIDDAIYFYRSSNGTCSVASLDLTMDTVNPPGLGVTDLQYPLPGGMTIPAGKALCLYDTIPTNIAALVTAWGYTVASSAVPANAAPAGAPKGAALLKTAKQ